MNATRKSKSSSGGGARNTGKTLKNNTSGLAGIWFQQRLGTGENPVLHTYICAAYTEGKGAEKKAKRTAFSIRTNGERNALFRAIGVRANCGLPTPTFEAAEEALTKFLQKTKPKTRAQAKVKPKPKEPPL